MTTGRNNKERITALEDAGAAMYERLKTSESAMEAKETRVQELVKAGLAKNAAIPVMESAVQSVTKDNSWKWQALERAYKTIAEMKRQEKALAAVARDARAGVEAQQASDNDGSELAAAFLHIDALEKAAVEETAVVGQAEAAVAPVAVSAALVAVAYVPQPAEMDGMVKLAWQTGFVDLVLKSVPDAYFEMYVV